MLNGAPLTTQEQAGIARLSRAEAWAFIRTLRAIYALPEVMR
jgi:hypothetical protein